MVAFTGNAQLTKEQQVIQKIFFNFLKFYKNNEKKFNSFKLYKGKGKDNSPPYKVQWAEAEKYFAADIFPMVFKRSKLYTITKSTAMAELWFASGSA